MTSSNRIAHRLLAISLATLTLAAGPVAMADSQYGYATVPSTVVTATARVTLAINVPKLILLRVGSTTIGGDTLTWNSSFDIPSPVTIGNNQNYTWTGAAPVASTSATPGALLASAWTNALGGGNLTYSATAFNAGGPTLANITVGSITGSGAPLNHPLPAVLATASTTATSFAANTLSNSSWTYTLAGTPGTWTAGAYTSVITYTATSL